MLDVVQNYSLIKQITCKVYYGSRFSLLRTRIEPEDLEQMVFLKLYHNDLYKVYSDEYSLKNFIYRVAKHCAINYSSSKSTQSERSVLDSPISSDCERSMLDFIDSNSINTSTYNNDPNYSVNNFSSCEFNVNDTVEFIASKLDSTINPRQIIVIDGEETPFSMENLFRLFVKTQGTKSEFKSYILNSHTRKPIAQVTIDAIWKRMMSEVEELLKQV